MHLNFIRCLAAEALKAQAEAMLEQAEAKREANPNMPSGEHLTDMNKAQRVMNQALRMEG